MGGGASRMAKLKAKYEGTPAGQAKVASRDLVRAAEALNRKLEQRGLELGSADAEVKLATSLAVENDPRTLMPLQLTERVRLTPAAVRKHVRSEKDRQVNLQPGDLAEIVELDGDRVRVRGPGHPGALTTVYWYKRAELERPPAGWTVSGKAERKEGVGDAEVSSKDRSWAGAGQRQGVSVELDTLTATKSEHYKAPVWSGERTAVRERAIAEERFMFAHNYMTDRKFDAALECLDLALDYHPDRALCHATRGSCFVFLEKLEEALAEYERACELNPSEGSYWRGSGMANFYLGRLLEAEEQLRTAVDCGYEDALQDLEVVMETNQSKEDSLQETVADAAADEELRQARKEREERALANREEAEALAAEADAAREEEEARMAEEERLKELADVDVARQAVDAAELELMKVRDDPAKRAAAEATLAAAQETLREEEAEAEEAARRAEQEREEAEKAAVRAARERREAEAAKELANRGANLEETDRLVLAERVARRQRPLDEEDVRQRSRVRLSPYGVAQMASKQGCLQPGDVGTIVMLSSTMPKDEQGHDDPDRRRVRVQGPSTVRTERRKDGTEKRVARSGHSAFYEQRELERPPLHKMWDEELPSGISGDYLAYMKMVDSKELASDLITEDHGALIRRALALVPSATEPQLLALEKHELIELILDDSFDYYKRLGAKKHVKAVNAIGVPSESSPKASDFDDDPVQIAQVDAAENAPTSVEFQDGLWSVSFRAEGVQVAVGRRVAGAQDELRAELEALPKVTDVKALREELDELSTSVLARRAISRCASKPVEEAALPHLSKDKLVDLVLASPAALQKGLACSVALWKGERKPDIGSRFNLARLETQLTGMDSEAIVDRISDIQFELSRPKLIGLIVEHSSVVQRAISQAIVQGQPLTGIAKMERALTDMNKEKVIDWVVERQLGPTTLFDTHDWSRRVELEQQDAAQAAAEAAKLALTDEQLGLQKDVGDALNDFFKSGMGPAVVNPAKHDIRKRTETDIRERELDHGLAFEMKISKSDADRIGNEQKAYWQKEIAQMDILRQQRRRVEDFHASTARMSVTDVMNSSKQKQAEAARQARVEERALRQAQIKGGTAVEEYSARQMDLARQTEEKTKERTHTAIHEYARVGDVDSLAMVVTPDTLDRPGMFGDTPLICAASEGQTATVKLLISLKASVDAKDDDGMTPLMWACASKTPDAVEAILLGGALVTLTDASGNTAMDWTASQDLQGKDVTAKRSAMKNENKRRWGFGGKGAATKIERTGADWKTGWAVPTGEDWSLTTWLGPAKPRAAINKTTGMLKHTDFTMYRNKMPDLAKYPGLGYDTVQVVPSLDVVGRHWDRLNRYDSEIVSKETKEYEAIMRGELAEDVRHDLAWHDLVGTLTDGGAVLAKELIGVFYHCQSALGYAITSTGALLPEREALTELRDRLRDIIRLFSGGSSEAACQIISALPERDDETPQLASTETDKLAFQMDSTARTRRKLEAVANAPPAVISQPKAEAEADPELSPEPEPEPEKKLSPEPEPETEAETEGVMAVSESDDTPNLVSKRSWYKRKTAGGTAGQLTLRILAHMLVAADDIPGRAACNADSASAIQVVEAAQAAVDAEKDKEIAANLNDEARYEKSDAAAELATAREEQHEARQAAEEIQKELDERIKAMEKAAQTGVDHAKKVVDVDEATMRLTKANIELKNSTQQAEEAKEAYDATVEAHKQTTKAREEAEERAEQLALDAKADEKARVAAAREEWRSQWAGLSAIDCLAECERLGLPFHTDETADQLHDRLANYTASTLALAVVERFEVLLIHLYDTDGLRNFLTRQLGPDLYLDVYTQLREVERAVYVRNVHWETTEGFLQNKFEFFGQIETCRITAGKPGTDDTPTAGTAVLIFVEPQGATAAGEKGSMILNDRSLFFENRDAETALNSVVNGLEKAGKSAALERLQHLVEMDVLEAEIASGEYERKRLEREYQRELAAREAALEEERAREAKEAAEREAAEAEAAVEYTAKSAIFDMLDGAMGLTVKLSASMEARKAARNEEWGLTSTGAKQKEKPFPSLDTPDGSKLYNLITTCVRAARMVTAQDLKQSFTEAQLIGFIGLPPNSRSHTSTLELANWFMPVATRYWDEVADALALKGAKKRGSQGHKSKVWKKARGKMMLKQALGKSNATKELSFRSAAAKGDRKQLNRMIREGVSMNASNKLGWTAYHYALRNGHADIAKMLLMSGADETEVPTLSDAEKLTSKRYEVVARAMIREDYEVTSAEVGFLEKGEEVFVLKIRVDANGAQRARIDRGWVTISGSSAQQSDARTACAVRLVPILEKDGTSKGAAGLAGGRNLNRSAS